MTLIEVIYESVDEQLGFGMLTASVTASCWTEWQEFPEDVYGEVELLSLGFWFC